jgi:hypothetical protein
MNGKSFYNVRLKEGKIDIGKRTINMDSEVKKIKDKMSMYYIEKPLPKQDLNRIVTVTKIEKDFLKKLSKKQKGVYICKKKLYSVLEPVDDEEFRINELIRISKITNFSDLFHIRNSSPNSLMKKLRLLHLRKNAIADNSRPLLSSKSSTIIQQGSNKNRGNTLKKVKIIEEAQKAEDKVEDQLPLILSNNLKSRNIFVKVKDLKENDSLTNNHSRFLNFISTNCNGETKSNLIHHKSFYNKTQIIKESINRDTLNNIIQKSEDLSNTLNQLKVKHRKNNSCIV